MKLVEIKNSLAKLYYEPVDFPLVLSDFLTVDDGNQKILAQVVSIESTNKEDVNCAILKFSLNLDDSNNSSSYSGYVPALDAIVSKTKKQIVEDVFSSKNNYIDFGVLTNSTKANLKISSDIINNFLYIQSDCQEKTEIILNKLINFNNQNKKRTLVISSDNLIEFANTHTVTLGKDLKLPVNNDTLNYIYENDLTGLTVEQKTIVQDIILEIQDYINTLEDGYIPFNTLLEVVNEIYETDKSTGVILLRNKLIKYNQLNIFASTAEEINALYDSLNNKTITILDISNIDTNWQKETVNFALRNIIENCYVIMNINDEIITEKELNIMYKDENIYPILASKYTSTNEITIKSFAQNLILFKPEKQQKNSATYNSFLTKLTPEEFIISGKTTHYTPLIIEEIPHVFNANISTKTIVQKTEQDELNELLAQNDEIMPLDSNDSIEIEEEESEIKAIFDETLENEIAKDVDKMFYSEKSEQDAETNEIILDEQEPKEQLEEINYDELISDDDLDILEEINQENQLNSVEAENEIELEEENLDIENIEQFDEIDDNDGILNDYDTIPLNLESHEIQQNNILESLTENDSLPSLPIFKADSAEPNVQSADGIKITEGNIVYHEKYGKGVVEELFNYGKRTLCSIQFDNVGRRLLDPNLAELKQM